MVKIGLLQPDASYGPEVPALSEYLSDQGGMNVDVLPVGADSGMLRGYDIIYRKMGFSPFWSARETPEIHDYSSLSSGRFRVAKDIIKRRFAAKPIFRSFLNGAVEAGMAFSDGVPFIFRDMGVPRHFLANHESATFEYDFCYAGSISKSRDLHTVLSKIMEQNMSVLLIGDPEDFIYRTFKSYPRCVFAGRIGRTEIAREMRRCRFGLNYVPDRYPWCVQTSTKLLEYCAVGLPVVTNEYAWARYFEGQSGGCFFSFTSWRQFERAAIERFEYRVPPMEDYIWESVFERSGILQMIRNKLL